MNRTNHRHRKRTTDSIMLELLRLYSEKLEDKKELLKLKTETNEFEKKKYQKEIKQFLNEEIEFMNEEFDNEFLSTYVLNRAKEMKTQYETFLLDLLNQKEVK